MFKFKSVVFVVCIIAICGVFGKNTLRKLAQPKPNGSGSATGTGSGSVQTGGSTTGQIGGAVSGTTSVGTTPPPQVLDPNSQKPSPLDGEVHKFRNLLADAEGREQELAENQTPEDFADFVHREFERSDKDHSGKIDFEEYKGRLGEIAQRYFVPKEFVDEVAEELFEEINYNDEDDSEAVLDEEEFAGLVYIALEDLVEGVQEIKGTPLEKVFNVRAFFEELRPDDRFPCDKVVNNDEAAKYIKKRVERIPLKQEAVNELLKNLSGNSPRSCEDLKKEVGGRLEKLSRPIKDALDKAVVEAGLNVTGSVSLLKSKKGRKARKARKNRKNRFALE